MATPEPLDAELKVIYRPMEAAARWSGLRRHERRVLKIVGNRHRPDPTKLRRWPLLHLNAQRLYDAMVHGDLPYGRHGVTCISPLLLEDDPALTLRHVDLRRWMVQFYPSERPSFLFASWEHDLQPAVSLNTLQVLSADREALRLQLLERDGEIDALRNELVDATRKLASMALSTEEALRPRSEGTYLNIVGGLLGLLLGKSPAGKPFSSFGTTESIVSALLAHHSGRPGMSERTLRAKFAAAKRHLDA